MATKKTKAGKPAPQALAPGIADARLAELEANLRRTKTADEAAAETVGWYEGTMNASHWFSRARVKPAEAAMVLCQHDPIAIDIGRALKVTTDATTPDDLAKLIQNFEDLAEVSPGHRTLTQWIAYARAKRLRHHPWVDEYVSAAGIDILRAPGDAAAPATSEPIPPRVPLMERNCQAVLVALKNAGHDPLNLPPFDNGKKCPAKAAALVGSGLTESAFGHAWRSLSNSGKVCRSP